MIELLIQKGGISRNIDPKNLQRYRDKGYVPAEQTAAPPRSSVPDPKAGAKNGSAGK